MNSDQPAQDLKPESPAAAPAPPQLTVAAAGFGPVAAEAGQPPPVASLTAEEQMALFEKELKEKDWGHQPC